MKKLLPLLCLSLSTLLLSGCLITYFFAPKISKHDLPGGEALEPLKQAYIQHCSRCHLLIAPEFFRYNVTIEIVLLRYLQERVINEKEAQQVRDYILAITKDPVP
jgi:hypothetical protein